MKPKALKIRLRFTYQTTSKRRNSFHSREVTRDGAALEREYPLHRPPHGPSN